jgi:ribosomal protein S18 acetylase RimI-like enzyme
MRPPLDDKMDRLTAASNPRRATLNDAAHLSKLFASAFMDDPLFDYMIRGGAKHASVLEMFFHEVLAARDIPQGEVWMSSDGNACVCWLSPDAQRSPGGLIQKLRWLPFFIRVYGLANFSRSMSIMDAMERNHPVGRHFYLSFIAVSPKYFGMGLGSRILKATFKQIDASGFGAYVESSNPKNATFYERAGFVAQKNIAPAGAPSLIAMWREAKTQ